MAKRFYIAYGSNLNLPQMRGRCPGATVVGTAVIENYRLLFNWRLAVTIVLQDCFNTPELRERLMSIRGKVFGRQRVLLGDTPSDMVAPLEISEGLYLESRFDTESLLYVLTRRVLAPVGYNYNEVLIQLRS